jgi:HAD superfamily hydrolase (TIGR01549 family)
MNNTIILDFDGVILESVSVKTDAFRDLFSAYPEHVEEIVLFHKKNGGMSRFDKFRYIYKNILKMPLREEEMQALSQKFTQLVLTKVLCVPYVPGAEEFLNQCSGKMSLFVVSATPQEELEYIIEKRGLKQFFNNVFGSPKRKEEHIKNILSENSVPAGSVVFIGDSLNDWKAAQETGIRFIARLTPESRDDFLGRPGIEHTIYDLHELCEYVRRAGCL